MSESGWARLCERKGWIVNPNGVTLTLDGQTIDSDDVNRTDPDLVAVVEEMGEDAGVFGSKLKVVDVPDDVRWYIHDNDGLESVHEEHRVWR